MRRAVSRARLAATAAPRDLRQRPRALTAALRLAALRQQPAYLHVLVAAPIFESKIDAKVS